MGSWNLVSQDKKAAPESHRKEVIPGRARPGQMMHALYYDRDGRPVSQERWRQLGRRPGYSRVGYADGIRHGRQVTVITFWSGIAAARAGHQAVTAWIADVAAFLAGITSQLPPPGPAARPQPVPVPPGGDDDDDD
jgi:hypothetical protein